MGPATCIELSISVLDRLCVIGDGWFLSEFVVLRGQPIFRYFHLHSTLTGSKQTSMSVNHERKQRKTGWLRKTTEHVLHVSPSPHRWRSFRQRTRQESQMTASRTLKTPSY